MNEARTIRRYCACCGEWFDIYLNAKNHWWQKRSMNQNLSGGYYFGTLPLGRYRIIATGKVVDSQMVIIQLYPRWKEWLLDLWWRIEDRLDPPETAEYWECKKCYGETNGRETTTRN